MDFTLILWWCLGLSIAFTVIYFILGSLIFVRYKPKIAQTQSAIIILSVINLITKNAGFIVLAVVDLPKDTSFNIIQSFSMLTSACFFFSFQILTMHLCLQRRLLQNKDVWAENTTFSIFEMQENNSEQKSQLLLPQSESISLEQSMENKSRETSKGQEELNRVKKRFQIYFLLYLAVVLVVAFLTFYDISGSKETSDPIDYVQLGIGLIRLLILDMPILWLFVHELNQVKRILKTTKKHQITENQKSITQIRFLVGLLYIIPLFLIAMFTDRTVFNNVILRVAHYFDNQSQTPQWLISVIVVHIVFYTISDFLSSCIQLYLTYQFGVTQNQEDQEQEGQDDEIVRISNTQDNKKCTNIINMSEVAPSIEETMKFATDRRLTKEEEEIIRVYNHQSYQNQEFFKNLSFDQYNENTSKKFEIMSETFKISSR